jgi:uncharacterized radical SAM superfamily Fe-S cluster-containing enzyme
MSEFLLEYLDTCEIKIEGYVVTKPDKRILKYRKLSVLTVDEIPRTAGTGFLLGLPFVHYNDVIKNLYNYGFNDFFLINDYDKEAIKNQLTIPTNKTMTFEIDIVEHCNMKCRSCSNFSQLSKPYFLDSLEFEKDIKQLAHLSPDFQGEIWLTGGEPLLHPALNQFINITHKYLPLANIIIITNGVLLLKMDDVFWNTCKLNNVFIEGTSYPINLNYAAIYKKAESWGVKISFQARRFRDCGQYRGLGDALRSSDFLL